MKRSLLSCLMLMQGVIGAAEELPPFQIVAPILEVPAGFAVDSDMPVIQPVEDLVDDAEDAVHSPYNTAVGSERWLNDYLLLFNAMEQVVIEMHANPALEEPARQFVRAIFTMLDVDLHHLIHARLHYDGELEIHSEADMEQAMEMYLERNITTIPAQWNVFRTNTGRQIIEAYDLLPDKETYEEFAGEIIRRCFIKINRIIVDLWLEGETEQESSDEENWGDMSCYEDSDSEVE